MSYLCVPLLQSRIQEHPCPCLRCHLGPAFQRLSITPPHHTPHTHTLDILDTVDTVDTLDNTRDCRYCRCYQIHITPLHAETALHTWCPQFCNVINCSKQRSAIIFASFMTHKCCYLSFITLHATHFTLMLADPCLLTLEFRSALTAVLPSALVQQTACVKCRVYCSSCSVKCEHQTHIQCT